MPASDRTGCDTPDQTPARLQPQAIVLFGVSGSGKTTVGERLAPSLNATFIDADDYHSAANIAKMHAGIALDDADRRPWLEQLGHVIAEHIARGRSVVVACSALRRFYRDQLALAAQRPLIFVHLAMPPTVLDARLRSRTQHFMPPSLLQSQLTTLEPLQDDENGTEIAETGTPEQAAEAIRFWLNQCTGGRIDA